MQKRNYDNALTFLEEDKVIQLTIQKLLESIDKLEKLENNSLLNESKLLVEKASTWDYVKFYLGKLGRYKAGGKITGKGKIDQEAGAKIQSILDKKGNEAIKTLDATVKKLNSQDKGEFPNNLDPDIFLNIVLTIAEVYDSIVAATKLNPKEKGYLPVDAANAVIADLREYVKKYLDVDVQWTRSIMDSEEEKSNENGSEEEVLITDSEVPLDEDRESDVRSQLRAKKGDNAEEIDSERMKTLKSWRLPLALMGAGASFGALSWLVEYMFPAEKITTYTPEEVRKLTQETIGQVDGNDGMTQTFNSIKSLGANLNPNSSPEEVVKVLSKIGGGDPNAGVDIITQKGGMFVDPTGANQTLHELVSDPHKHGDTLKEVFASDSTRAGTGKVIGDTLATHHGGTLTMLVVKSFIKWGTKTTFKKGLMLTLGAPILKTLGIGLLATGALVKLFREKGKRQSRAATLNELLQSLQFVEGPSVLPQPEVEEKSVSGRNICNAKNLNELNKLLADTKALSQPLKEIKTFERDPEFRKLFIEAFIGSTRQIKINQEPLLKTLKKLKENGLLEYGDPSGGEGSMTGSRRKYVKLTYQSLQNFLNSLMKLFGAVYKSCKKTSKTFQVIKNFFKQLFIIASQGKGNFSDEKTREQLWKKLNGNFSNFLNQLNKLPDMEKGKVEKTSPESPEEGRGGEKGVEGTFSGSAPRTKPPQLAHYDRGENYVMEEMIRIKKLMK